MKRALIIPVGVLALAGCTLAPDYKQPETPQVNSWQGSAQSQPAAQQDWRRIFPDPALQQIVNMAIKNNNDLRLAALNVQRYQAQYRIQRADLIPSVNVSGTGTREQTAADFNASGEEEISSRYSAAVGITSYELDLFGRVRSLKEQALQSYLAQEETRRSTQISLVANVVNAYLTLVADTQLLNLSEQNLRIEQDNYDLVQRRYKLGVDSNMELAQAKGSLEDAQVTTEQYRRLAKVDRNALALLLGKKLPENWHPVESLSEVKITSVKAGLPSTLLTQRPDILAAEHNLRAANANIGAARAAFLPNISLTASAGSASEDLNDLFDSGSHTWSFSPQISLPIFTGGRLTAQLDVAKLEQRSSIVEYEQAIENAFTEVSNSLIRRTAFEKQLQHQEQAESAYRQYFDIADLRYQKGTDSMLTRLDAQRNFVSAQQATVNARLSWLQAQVNFYQSLGGGWNPEDRSISDPAPEDDD